MSFLSRFIPRNSRPVEVYSPLSIAKSQGCPGEYICDLGMMGKCSQVECSDRYFIFLAGWRRIEELDLRPKD